MSERNTVKNTVYSIFLRGIYIQGIQIGGIHLYSCCILACIPGKITLSAEFDNKVSVSPFAQPVARYRHGAVEPGAGTLIRAKQKTGPP